MIGLLGWFVLVPAAWLAAIGRPMEAGLVAALVGAAASASAVLSPPLRTLLPLSAIPSALSWGALSAAAAAYVPSDWLIVALPTALVVATQPLRFMGAPRFVYNPLVRTQEHWLVVVHTARFGGDGFTFFLLAMASTSIALMGAGRFVAGGAGAFFVFASLGAAFVSLKRATRAARRGPSIRVAAVVVDGAPPPEGVRGGLWPTTSAEYRDIDGTIDRYRPHVIRAATAGAAVVVLPEVAVYVEGDGAHRWQRQIGGLAAELGIAIVAPYYDASVPKNTLAVVDASGVVGIYDKQHPGRGLEPPRLQKMEVGPHRLSNGSALSTAICVDLDYPDTAASARRAHTIVAAPSNDWFGGFEKLHHKSAVWAAVVAGVPVVRATGHGISAVYDGAGRVVAEQSSADGPVVLITDVTVP